MQGIFFDTNLKIEKKKEQYIGKKLKQRMIENVYNTQPRNFDTLLDMLSRASQKMRFRILS